MPTYLDLVYNGAYLAKFNGLEYWRYGEGIFLAYTNKDIVAGPFTGYSFLLGW